MPRRIAMYTHSLNPRGGVVHALSLAEALRDIGYDVTLVAPALPGEELFRRSTLPTALFPASAGHNGLVDFVAARVAEYTAFTRNNRGDFDLYHAHDGMSGFALAQLRVAGEIPAFVRTVHHLDEFKDPYLHDAQNQSVLLADRLFCVSQVWADDLFARFGRSATVVSNGVDRTRFSPDHKPDDRAICELVAGCIPGPMILCVGGVERRKNTTAALEAFLQLHRDVPDATLVIAGGASLLDHSVERRAFDAICSRIDDPQAVRLLGPVDDDTMPALYRTASVFLFPSLIEGFGLSVLEAMACGTPVVTSRLAPFTEYLTDADAVLVDPTDVSQIASGLRAALQSNRRGSLISNGFAVASRFSWSTTARQCGLQYDRLPVFSSGVSHARDAICGPLAG